MPRAPDKLTKLLPIEEPLANLQPATPLALSRTAHKAREATERRDELIRELYGQGLSLRTLGNHAGLSHTAIAKILAR